MPPKQTTLGRFFILPARQPPPDPLQTKLKLKSVSPANSDDDTSSSSKTKRSHKKGTLTKNPKPKNGNPDGDLGNVGLEDSSLDIEMSHGPGLAKNLSEETSQQSPRRKAVAPAKNLAKRTREAEKIKEEPESPEDIPVTKRPKPTKAAGSPKAIKKSGENYLSSEDDDPVTDRRRNPTTPNKSKRKRKIADVVLPASPFESAQGIKCSPITSTTVKPRASKARSPDIPDPLSPTKTRKPRSSSGAVALKKEAALKSDDKPEGKLVLNVSESESESEKPTLAEAARKAVIVKLASPTPPAYPDWPNGEPMPYAALVTTFNLLESTTKRLEKVSYTSRLFQQVLRRSSGELLLVIHLMINKLAADFEGVEMGIGESLLMKAIGESCGRSLEKIREDQRECGDLGLVAMKSRNNQRTLFTPQPLSVAGVHKGLLKIAGIKGERGQGLKVAEIRKLLAAAKGDEAKFLIRGLEGKLRLGLAERSVIVSLSGAMIAHEAVEGKAPTPAMLAKAELILRGVFSELPSYEVIIPAMMKYGIMNIKEHCKLQPGVPVKPMLARPTKSISEVLDRFENKRFTCEYKYDGERAQIHYVSPKSSIEYPPPTLGAGPIKNLAKVFSRNSEDLSGKYPDILAAMNKWVRPEVESFVLDCEAVGWDPTNRRLLPFQMLQTRKKKDVALADVKIKVCVHAFDLLFLNGKPLVRESLSDRRKLMHETFIEVPDQFVFAKYMDSIDLEEIRVFLDQSVKDSCEGLMVKMMDGPESFYQPSWRSQNWLKIKKDYLNELGDSLDLVVIGAYWGRGKRTSVYGSFLLACYNPGTQNYESLCNIGTGFSEAELNEFYETLHPLEIERAKPFYNHSSGSAGKPDVWFDPKVIWEVKAADLTLSPRYKAAAGLAGHPDKGVSLRFPRFVGPRTDKAGEDATSSRQIAEMYLRQDQVANPKKTGAKAVDDDFEY